MPNPMPSQEILSLIRRGAVIPASPLALDEQRRHAPRHQKALYEYYTGAGADGVAVAVHTTQFEIREPQHALFDPLLKLAADKLSALEKKYARPIIKVAGVCGRTQQAVREANVAMENGYDCGLLSLAAMGSTSSDDELIAHCRAVAERIPLIGFYLQPAVGGRILPYSFWRRFAEIENVIAIKIAPFNRYQTIDVVRAVGDAGRERDITLYTGNDDNMIGDLLTPFTVGEKTLRIRGGLLGQWSVWTRSAVELLKEIHAVVEAGDSIPFDLLRRNAEFTDANAVVFDAAHGFAGCIPGINEVLRRQGLLPTRNCLNPHEQLSPGQAEELDRVCRQYRWLPDDDFISSHLNEWLEEA